MRTFVATQIWRKVAQCRNFFLAARFFRSRIEFCFSQRMRQRRNNFVRSWLTLLLQLVTIGASSEQPIKMLLFRTQAAINMTVPGLCNHTFEESCKNTVTLDRFFCNLYRNSATELRDDWSCKTICLDTVLSLSEHRILRDTWFGDSNYLKAKNNRYLLKSPFSH